MKLSLGITATLLSCGAAAAQPSGQAYLFPGPESSTAEALSPGLANLVLLQRLAPFGKGLSVNDLPSGNDLEDVVDAMNQYGKAQPALFADVEASVPNQLVVMLTGMTEEQITEVGDALKVSPAFTIADISSLSSNEIFPTHGLSSIGVMNQHGCSIGQVVNQRQEQCWSGKSTAATYHVPEDAQVVDDLIAQVQKLIHFAQVGEMETAVLLLPSAAQQPDDLRRRQAEQPITPHIADEEPPVETSSSHPVFFASSGAIPACFSSADSCSTETRNCSGHGVCQNKYAKPDGSDAAQVCFTCHCLSTKSDSGSVTHWAGPSCTKKDVSVAFWLFVGFTVAMVGILSLAIGMLFSVGEEKLPGVIGAGVSRSK
ncbi:hypothetical protein S40285_01059 [Stachybotrys chlorohalonatus IBT 40285]|uniref:Vacuolar sorting protein Vps3844 C-terminal domain-containing protein n=1 Tax=Stachybotrys chlorohalonatus (strain IBT 40285) TaxID=1283841 RepID=A0A084QKA2_STAC4|nr:hypothetical protein S40285_01059 [Stachybotrys chlorohalonata IBT 40285]